MRRLWFTGRELQYCWCQRCTTWLSGSVTTVIMVTKLEQFQRHGCYSAVMHQWRTHEMSYIRITSSATITTSSNHLVAENKTLSQSMALTGNQISSPEFFSPVTMTRIVHALTFVTITMAVSTKARAVTLSYAVDKCFVSSRVKKKPKQTAKNMCWCLPIQLCAVLWYCRDINQRSIYTAINSLKAEPALFILTNH